MDGPACNIWVLIEATGADAARVGFELLTPGRALADQAGQALVAVAIGADAAQAAAHAVACGADEAIAVDGDAYSHYQTEPFRHALAALIEAHRPSALLIGANDHGRDLAPRVACRFRTGLTADCTAIALQPDGQTVAWTRPALSGNLMATIVCADARPQMGTIRPGVFSPPAPIAGRTGPVRREPIFWDPAQLRVRTVGTVETGGAEICFEHKDVIVAGGRGLGSSANFQLVERLARALGGAVGASRGAVNEGWISYAHQIGQSGKTVRPKVYIACGISGAVQHLAGISGADTVIAINSDPDAPIFRAATYGIVGDLFTVIPSILDAWEKELPVDKARHP